MPLLSQYFSTVASQNLAKPAFRYLGKETNYTELRNSVGRLSYLFQQEIGNTGARVAFLARNSPAVIRSFLALTNIRAVTIPLDPDAAPADIGNWLRQSKATHVAVTNDLTGRVREILQAERLPLTIVEIEKKQGGEYDTSYSPPPESKPVETDPILLLKTGGTGGKPKFVVLTHKQVQHAAVSLRGIYRSTPADRFFTSMAWSHPYAWMHGMLLPILTGATCVIDHGPEGVDLYTYLLESRVSRMIGNPSGAMKLLGACKAAQKLPAGIKSFTLGLGRASPELRKVFDSMKIKLVTCYGQAENVWTVAMEEPAPAEEGHPGGRGLAGVKYKVMDAQGDEIPGKDKRTGMLAVTGPTVMHSYYGDAEATKAALRGTWLYTGDVAELEGDGDELRINFIGRKNEVMEVGGEMVPISRVDATLRTLSGVMDAAAFIATDIKNEQVVCCAIVKAPGSPVGEKQVLEYCVGRVPSSMIPRTVVITDVIPRDAGGNVVSARLRGLAG